MISPDRARAHLADEIDQFVGLLADADLDAPIAACPGWSVRDLVVHLGEVHRWVAQAMSTGSTEEPPSSAPTDDTTLADWYRATADDLLELFAATDADTPVWTFGPRPRTAAFWYRRQAHEVGVHLWDLGTATGVDVGYDPELALDGIDEVVTMFFPRQLRLKRLEPLPASLALVPDGGERRWVLAGDGTRPVGHPDATVTGPAAILLLLLWGRVDLNDERIRVSGAREAAEAVLAAKIVP